MDTIDADERLKLRTKAVMSRIGATIRAAGATPPNVMLDPDAPVVRTLLTAVATEIARVELALENHFVYHGESL